MRLFFRTAVAYHSDPVVFHFFIYFLTPTLPRVRYGSKKKGQYNRFVPGV